ncbi:MAG: flagellar motor switch protein FliM [Firmicutes bacterium]|nr:flagellar motor switch protein FliM [Bacillota bacterium]
MSEILSQEEVDALLSALSSGEVDRAKIAQEEQKSRVKTYDFRRPDKFSKDQVRTLQMIHENYARFLSTSLATYLRALVDVSVVSTQQMTYEEFIRSLPTPTVMTIFEVEELEGTGIFELSSGLALMMVERLLGGGINMPAKIRELTDIETNILARLITRFLGHLKEAWENLASFTATIERIESNPGFVQIVAPNQMIILITLSVRVGTEEGFINLCLPDSLLEPVLSKLTTHYWLGSSTDTLNPERRRAVEARLSETVVELVVRLGTTRLTVRDLLDLAEGDVIALPTRIDEAIPVYIGSQPKFFGKPGTKGSRMALQVTKVAEEVSSL